MNLFGGIDRFSDVRGGVRIEFVGEIEKYFRLILSARDPHRAHVVSLGFPALDHGIL
jgi:hypothetical protein